MARLLALAHHLRGKLDRGEVKSRAEIARLGHVTRARVTQIMNLLLLAPDIQEQILFLPPAIRGRYPISERDLRLILRSVSFREQRRVWRWPMASTRPALRLTPRIEAGSSGCQASRRSQVQFPFGIGIHCAAVDPVTGAFVAISLASPTRARTQPLPRRRGPWNSQLPGRASSCTAALNDLMTAGFAQ